MAWGSPRYQPPSTPATARGLLMKYNTIMGYPQTRRDGIRIPFYSTPHVYYKGELTGGVRGMFLPPPMSSYTTPFYFDNARAITAVGHLASYYRDSNGSGRPSSRTSVRHTHPAGRPADPRNVNYSSNPNQANAKGGSSGTAAAPAPTQVGPGGTTNRPGIPLGGGGNPTQPVIPPGGGLGTGGGGGLPPGGTNTVPNLPINPAVPNDHRYPATKWPGGRWANNNTRFATVINGHNNGATRENTERNHPAFHGKSVWWYIEWPANKPAITLKQLEATTKGSTFDTTLGVMYVRKGQLAAQVDLNSGSFRWNNNAPGGAGPFSTVVLEPNPDGDALTLNAGDRVYFMVDGVGGATGKIRLGVKMKK